jgi:hypothetical protein
MSSTSIVQKPTFALLAMGCAPGRIDPSTAKSS